MTRKFYVITEARAIKTIPGYQRFLMNGMTPKRPRGYVVQVVPPIQEVQTQPDDVEGIGASYHNVGKARTIHTAGWYLHKKDAENRVVELPNNSFFNREYVLPVTRQVNCF